MPKRTPEQTAGRDRRSLTRPADFDALPRRFKDYVQTLESALYAARKTLDQPPTRVRLEPRNTLTGDPLVRYLPESEAVKFYTGGPDKHSAIEVRLTPVRHARLGALHLPSPADPANGEQRSGD